MLQSLNGYRHPVTQSQFLTEVEAAGGETVRNTTATEIDTTATCDDVNGTTHRQWFGMIPARSATACHRSTGQILPCR